MRKHGVKPRFEWIAGWHLSEDYQAVRRLVKERGEDPLFLRAYDLSALTMVASGIVFGLLAGLMRLMGY